MGPARLSTAIPPFCYHYLRKLAIRKQGTIAQLCSILNFRKLSRFLFVMITKTEEDVHACCPLTSLNQGMLTRKTDEVIGLAIECKEKKPITNI